ncbi:hypothetical protein DL98DRAFT_118010 [Cadophora sp. DSE1049]|nr:hypothetical protein DL98DRAFT_118010 [Cadophora sp. DSE1049]
MAESQLCDMEVIYSPEPSDDAGYNDEVVRPALDIIIVGSMVDPTHQLPDSKSQAENQSRWFQDLLPEHISSARVMLFSRQSTATEDSAQDRTLLSAENLTQFAKALLERLTIERADDEYENVPITFVGYDLGGSIVKKALTLASESEEKADLAIFNNTCRLLFFGTPHRAHNIMSWVNLLFNIISSVPSPQPLKLNLHRRAIEISKELDSLSIAFSSIALRYSLINIYQVDVDAPMDWGDTVRPPQNSISQSMLYWTVA